MSIDVDTKVYLLEGNYEYGEGTCQFIGCINKLAAGDFAGYLMEDEHNPSKVTSTIRGKFIPLEKELSGGYLLQFINFSPLEETLNSMIGKTFSSHYHKLLCSKGLEGVYKGYRYQSTCNVSDEPNSSIAARAKIKLESEIRFPMWFILKEYIKPAQP
jgi:hypothetical protein